MVGGCASPASESQSAAPPAAPIPQTSPSGALATGPYSFPFPAPSEFVAEIDHPLLPLRAGAEWVYEEVSENEKNRIVVTVTDRSKIIEGSARWSFTTG